MRSPVFIISITTIAMLQNVCHLAISSPALSRSQAGFVDNGESLFGNKIAEDPIINDEPSNTSEKMELNPRPNSVRVIGRPNIAAVKNGGIKSMISTASTIDQGLNSSISETPNSSATESNEQQERINGSNADDRNSRLQNEMVGNKSPKVPHQNAPLNPKFRLADSKLNRLSDSNVKSKPDLMERNKTKLPVEMTTDSDRFFHTHLNDSKTVDQNVTKNRHLENERDGFLQKHTHLAELLLHSSFSGTLFQENDTKEKEDGTTPELGVETFSRMIEEPNTTVNIRKDKNDGFQDRSDVNFTKGKFETNEDMLIDRSLEIDASHIDEKSNFELVGEGDANNLTSTENDDHQQEPTNIEEGNKSKGFFDFLRSLFF